MSEDVLTGLITEFFTGGWRVAPFIKTQEGYIGVKAWPKRAATNAAELHALMQEQAKKSSKAPVLGIAPARGKYVVDIDTKKNEHALQLWKDKVAEAYGTTEFAIPNLVVKTKSGGYHLYYSDGSDRQIHSPTSVFSKDSGIDIRGFTGMVIAPTSIGTEMEWQLGDYTIVKGRPSDAMTVLGLSKILGDSEDEEDVFVKSVLFQVNESLRNDSVNELQRHKFIPDAMIIPSSNRDNTIYRCARMCRLAGLSQEAASQYMVHIAHRCEATPEEPLEHWIQIALDKVKRVYASETEMKLQTVSGLYDELDNAGTVMIRGVSKSYWYFRHSSKVLGINARDKFSTDNVQNALQGISIHADDGQVPVKKFLGSYQPKEVVYGSAMYPRNDMPFFEFEGLRYVNTYFDQFASFEPNPELLHKALPYVESFIEFTRHITGYEPGDAEHLLDKLAWIVQRPYRRMPTGTIIYSHTRGSGKDVFMGLVREIIGRNYYMPITLASIENPHTTLHDKLICVASEVQLQTNARGTIGASNFMGIIKDKITQKITNVDEKFIQAYKAPIYANFFLLSNFELSSILEPGDRRFDIFHAAESKFDQNKFSDLADITSDGLWIERSHAENQFRMHVIYALRMGLMNRQLDAIMDREEAKMNPVKTMLMDTQNPPMIEWMRRNLPTYFTEDTAMMACAFCPMRAHPEYIMKQLKEHYGPEMRPLYRNGRTIYRMNGAPLLEKRHDGSSGSIPVMQFNVKTSDVSARRSVYSFGNTIRDTNPTDGVIRSTIKVWYEQMIQQYYGNVATLPNMKPEGAAGLEV